MSDEPRKLTLKRPGADDDEPPKKLTLSPPGGGGDAPASPPTLQLKPPGGDAPAAPRGLPPGLDQPAGAPPAGDAGPPGPPPAPPPPAAAPAPPPAKGEDEPSEPEKGDDDGENAEGDDAAEDKGPQVSLKRRSSGGFLKGKFSFLVWVIPVVLVFVVLAGFFFTKLLAPPSEGEAIVPEEPEPAPAAVAETPAEPAEPVAAEPAEPAEPTEPEVADEDVEHWGIKASSTAPIAINDLKAFGKITDAFTIEYWAKTDKQAKQAGLRGDQDGGFRLQLTRNNGELQAGFVLGDNAVQSAAPREHGWIHLAVVYAGAADKNLSLYVNGSQMGQVACTTPPKPTSPSLQVFVEALGEEKESSLLMDELRISSVARYDKHFRPTRLFEPDESTVVLLHLDKLESGKVGDAAREEEFEVTDAGWADVGGSVEAANSEQIAFPFHLLVKIEKEFGVKGRQQCLEEWAKYGNEKRKSYLEAMGEWIE